MKPEKNRGGRPPGRIFTKALNIMLTAEDDARLRSAAAAAQVSVAEFVRQALREADGMPGCRPRLTPARRAPAAGERDAG